MRRRAVVTILAGLLLGGVIQAAVACVLALRSPMGSAGLPTGTMVELDRDERFWYSDWLARRSVAERSALAAALDMWPRPEGPAGAVSPRWANIQHWDGVGVSFTSGGAWDRWPADGDGAEWESIGSQRYAAGWPMRSMRAIVDRHNGLHGGVVAPDGWMGRDRAAMIVIWEQPPVRAVIPLRPIALGTAVNSLVFASPFLLVPLARRVHRRRRAHVGECPHCGYSRSGLASAAPCPECGHPSANGSPGESGGGVGAAARASGES